MAKPTVRVTAKLFSLGGVMLFGILLLLLGVLVGSLSFATYALAAHLVLLVFVVVFSVYLFDACSEQLVLDGDWLKLSSRLRKPVSVDLSQVCDVFIVHEGLNDERGIIRIRFTDENGQVQFFALGPCWRRHEVEGLFRLVESTQKSCKLVEQVR
ncbi:MAG: hypothetical protein U0487_02410 [Patescibacteria group bacterium]